MDKIAVEMGRRFNDNEVVPLILSIGACHPDSKQFLSMDVLRPFIDANKLDKTGDLTSQIDVCMQNTTFPGFHMHQSKTIQMWYQC